MSTQPGRSPRVHDRKSPTSPKSLNSPELAVDNPSTRQSTQSRDQSPPKRDPACEICTAPTRQRHGFDQDKLKGNRDRYALGEIIRINESIHTPIDPLLAGPSVQPSAATSNSNLGSRPRGEDKGPRPGVVLRILRREAEDSNGIKIMLMATFSGIYKLNSLPRVLQHFCMPVSPHYEIGANVEHLHTTPEWQKDHVWLILPPCVSSGTVSGRWKWRDEPGRSPKRGSFKVDRAILPQLENVFARRFKEWSVKCSEEEGYQEERRKEYQVFKCQGSAKFSQGQSSVGGSPLILQATREIQVPIEEDGDSGVHGSPRNADVQPAPPIPSPSDSQHTSASGRLMFGDAPLLDLDPGNRLGVSFTPTIEGWLRTLPPLPLDLNVAGEPFTRQEDFNTASAASTESIRDDAAFSDTKRAALEDATVTLPRQGAPSEVNVDESPATTSNNQAGHNDPSTSTSAQAMATPSLGSEDPKGPKESSAKPKEKRQWKKFWPKGDKHRKPH